MDDIEVYFLRRIEAMNLYPPLEGSMPGMIQTWAEVRERLIHEDEELLRRYQRYLQAKERRT